MLSGDPISQLGIMNIKLEQKLRRLQNTSLCIRVDQVDRLSFKTGRKCIKLPSKSLPTRQFTVQRGLKNPKKIEK